MPSSEHCSHEELEFIEGSYYLRCRICAAYWAAIDHYDFDRLDPDRQLQKVLTGEIRKSVGPCRCIYKTLYDFKENEGEPTIELNANCPIHRNAYMYLDVYCKNKNKKDYNENLVFNGQVTERLLGIVMSKLANKKQYKFNRLISIMTGE